MGMVFDHAEPSAHKDREEHFLFHYTNITPIYYSTFHLLFHYTSIAPIYYSARVVGATLSDQPSVFMFIMLLAVSVNGEDENNKTPAQ